MLGYPGYHGGLCSHYCARRVTTAAIVAYRSRSDGDFFVPRAPDALPAPLLAARFADGARFDAAGAAAFAICASTSRSVAGE